MHPVQTATRMPCLPAIIGCLACAATGAPERKVPETRDLHELMRDSLAKAEEAQFALIDGDILAAQTPAAHLANSVWPELAPKFWDVHIDTMKAGARRVANAFSVETAAAGLGAMASACGHCHQATAPDGFLADTPTAEPILESNTEMYGQLWAISRMYEGLIMASDKSWADGAKAAAELQLPDRVAETVAASADSTLVAAAELLRTAGASATSAKAAQRGRVYAQYLAACGSCHSHARHDLTRRPIGALFP